MSQVAQWSSPPPTACDCCEAKIETEFYDATTTLGRWAIMCFTCWSLGPGINRLGIGYG